MAKVLVMAYGNFRYFSPVSLEPYIQMFINSLVRNGNTVMPYIEKDIQSDKKFKNYKNHYIAYRNVKDFNPDIVFTFNNLMDERLLKKLDVPFYVMDADTPLYWMNKELIKKYNEKYFALILNTEISDLLKKDFNLNEEKQIFIPYTTDIRAKNIDQNKDITFIGNFIQSQWDSISCSIFNSKTNMLEKENIMRKVVFEIKDNFKLTNETYEEYKKAFQNHAMSKNSLEATIGMVHTNYIRNSLLNSLVDLDLNIYSTSYSLSCIDYNYKLYSKCHYNTVSTVEENEKVYNESKISLSFPHHQTKTGFSWRVCDILATNSMLISNKTEKLTQFFGDNVVTFKDEKDLKDKCLYYLNHEDERKDIVQKCQEIINKNHRFENLFKVFEEKTGYSLINSDIKGQIINTTRTQKILDKYNRKNKPV